MESIILKSNAHQKPSIFIPSIKLSANKITIAFIANKNKPSVTTVTGKVRKTKIGFTIASNKDNTTAKINAVKILSICTPDNILESTNAMSAEKQILIMLFILMDNLIMDN